MEGIRRGPLIAAIALAAVLAAYWFAPFMCANELLSEIRSPDGALKVVVFRRDCGATTAASIQASVVAVGAPVPLTRGNLFVADREFLITWTSPREIKVGYDPRARVFKSVARVDDVRASYVALQP